MANVEQAKIFKKIEVVEGGGHHGGGWKVAYADFMTAMMAFFLLLWILSSSDEQKLRGIAEYFTDATLPGGSGVLDGATLGPPGTLTASNGAVVARGSELGRVDDPSPARWEVRDTTPTIDPKETVLGTRQGDHENPAAGAQAEEIPEDQIAQAQSAGGAQLDNESELDGGADGQREAEVAQFAELQMQIMQAMEEHPDLRPLKENVVFEQTPEGLSIQVIDQQGKPMFASGNANLLNVPKKLMAELGSALAKLPNDIVLSGHTDSVPFANSAKYDNWDLSSDRANAIRRTFEASGVGKGRIIRVSGMADTQPLLPEDTKHPSNRRIAIFVQHSKPMMKKAAAEKDMMKPKDEMAKPSGDSKEAMQPKTEKAMAPKEPATPVATDDSRLTSIDDEVFEKLRNALR